MTARRPVQGAPFEPIAADDAQEKQPRSKSRLGRNPFIWDFWGGLAISAWEQTAWPLVGAQTGSGMFSCQKPFPAHRPKGLRARSAHILAKPLANFFVIMHDLLVVFSRFSK